MVSETHDAEEDGQEDETHKLNWLAADSIAQRNGDPVTWNSTSADENDVADSDVVVVVIDIGGVRAETNGGENGRIVETNTVEGNILWKVSEQLMPACPRTILLRRTTTQPCREGPCRTSIENSDPRSLTMKPLESRFVELDRA